MEEVELVVAMTSPVAFSFDAEHRCLIVKVTGSLAQLGTVSYYEQLRAAMEAHHSTRCLCDATEAEVDCRPVETVKASDTYFEVGLPRTWKRAMIVSPRLADRAEFWETAMRNRGHLVKVFRDWDSALAWLAE